MNLEYPLAAKAGVGACAMLALWGSLVSVGAEKPLRDKGGDPYMVAAQVAQLEPLRLALPDAAILGFVTDAEPGSVVNLAMYNAARYALAPRMIVEGVDRDAVLGYFMQSTDYTAFASQRGLRVEHDFGNGVVIFRRGTR